MADRGCNNRTLQAHLGGCQKMDIRQTRRGWFQEMCLGCEARTEFKYFVDGHQVAHSLESSNCCCRICCNGIHPFEMQVQELNTQANILTLERPLRCHASSCKCCCYQQGIVTTGTGLELQLLGSIQERCYICVPEFHIYDSQGNGLYRLHPPTCCCGLFVNVCAEGNPCCGRGCCKVPFHLFPYHQINTDNAHHVGKILKKPKSLWTELFTDANAFEVDFPVDATAEHKGVLVGAAILLNAIFFEEKHNEGQEAEEDAFLNFGGIGTY